MNSHTIFLEGHEIAVYRLLQQSANTVADFRSGRRALELWELVPIDTGADVWRFSKYTGRVVVRARDEAHARVIASQRFQAPRLTSEDGVDVVIGDPWHSGLLVVCRQLSASDSGWPVEGAPGVLFPSN